MSPIAVNAARKKNVAEKRPAAGAKKSARLTLAIVRPRNVEGRELTNNLDKVVNIVSAASIIPHKLSVILGACTSTERISKIDSACLIGNIHSMRTSE